MSQLSLEEAIKARDTAMRRVAARSDGWMEDALRIVVGIPRLQEVTGEEVRQWLLVTGLRKPHHPNAWGALILTAIRRGILVPTDRYRKMRTKKSHARMTRVYET